MIDYSGVLGDFYFHRPDLFAGIKCGCTIEVWEWKRNFIPHFTEHMITYPIYDYSWFTLMKRCQVCIVCCKYIGNNQQHYNDTIPLLCFLSYQLIWVRSRNCGSLVTWFCYQLIAKPGNKTAAVSWPDPYTQCHYIEVSYNIILQHKNSNYDE